MRNRSVAAIVAAGAIVGIAIAAPTGSRNARAGAITRPLAFEPAASGESFVLRGTKASLVLEAGEVRVHRGAAVTRMRLDGANRASMPRGEERLDGVSHYLTGSDPARWRRDVPRFARVRFREVYPGIDLVFRTSDGGELEFDLHVAARADVSRVRFSFPDASRMRVDRRGDLVVRSPAGELRNRKPIALQAGRSPRARWRALGANVAGFEIEGHDRERPFVIDPVVTWSSYLGGVNDDIGYAVAVDAAGGVWIAGRVAGIDFPTTPGAYQEATAGGTSDAFIAKLAANGSTLLYSTFLGGGTQDFATAIAVDAGGQVAVAGFTDSTNFPVTAGAISSTKAGTYDVFVAQLSADGSSLQYSTYLGGSGIENATSLRYSNGNLVVAGSTTSTNFPLQNALQSTIGGAEDAFVTAIDPAAPQLAWSTYFGGTSADAALALDADATGVYLAGRTVSTDFPRTAGAYQVLKNPSTEGFVTKLSPGGALLWSTYFGGNGADVATAVAAGPGGTVYVAGDTTSTIFPLSNGAFQTTRSGTSDAFASRLSADGSALEASTFLGGTSVENVLAMVADSAGNAVVLGRTSSSTTFPATSKAMQSATAGGTDLFVTRLGSSGEALLFSSYFGGSSTDDLGAIALLPGGGMILTGRTYSSNFPTTPGAFRTYLAGASDGFVSRLDVPPNEPLLVAPSTARVTSEPTINLMLDARLAPGQSVALASSDPLLLEVPPSVTVPAGATTVSFTGKAHAFGGPVTVTAQLPSGLPAATASISVTPATVSLSPATVTLSSGSEGQASVQLDAPLTAPVTVSLSSLDAQHVTVPASVTVPAGTTGVSFPIAALAPGGPTEVLATLPPEIGSGAASFLVVVEAILVWMTADDPQIPAGQQGAVTLWIGTPLGADATIAVSASSDAASVPATVTLAAGDSSVAIPVDALSPGEVTITATTPASLGAVEASTSLTIVEAETPPILSESNDGCACRMETRRSSPSLGALALAAAFALAVRRRRPT